MANKRQELKTLVKGKGLSALKTAPPSNEKITPIEKQSVAEPEVKAFVEEAKKDKILESKPEIIQLTPTDEEKEIIQNLTSGKAEYAIVWRTFTSRANENIPVFNKGETITFNIDCSVAKLMAQLHAPYSLEIISFDVRSQHSQTLYCINLEDRIPFRDFRVQFQIQAVLSGIFKVKSILIIPNTESFDVQDNCNFRVV